jgi:hypothetical protein
MADDELRSADDIADDTRLTPAQRRMCRLWLALIDDIVFETQLRERGPSNSDGAAASIFSSQWDNPRRPRVQMLWFLPM